MGQDLNGYKAKHEKSITVQKGKRWYNLDNSGGGKGNVLGKQGGYATMKEAETAAERRSDKYKKRSGKINIKKPKKL